MTLDASTVLITAVRSESDTGDVWLDTPITEKRGKETIVFAGTATAEAQTVRMSVYVNGQVARYDEKTAACANWSVVQ